MFKLLGYQRWPLLSVLAFLVLCSPATFAEKMPAEYTQLVGHVAAPLYPTGVNRPTQTLSYTTQRDGNALLALSKMRINHAKTLGIAKNIYTPLMDSGLCLKLIAGIDGIQPKGTDVLVKGLGAAVGREDAQKKFERSLGGFIAAEMAKGYLRNEYRKRLVLRRQQAWTLWEVAAKHAGPTMYRTDAYGIGLTYNSSEKGMRVIRVFKDLPAMRAGLRVGEVVTHIDGKSLKGKTTGYAAALFTGRLGSTVSFHVVDSKGVTRVLRAKRTARLPKQVLRLNFNSSFGGAYSNAVLNMLNTSGQTLTDVTVFVRMSDGKRTMDHTHYVKRWSKSQWLNAQYNEQSKYCPRETLEWVSKVEVWLYSNEATYNTSITYFGQDRAADLARMIEKASFNLKWHDRRKTLLGWQDAGCEITLEKRVKVRPKKVEITYIDGRVRKTFYWNMKTSWKSGWMNRKHFIDKRFNGMKPDEIRMKLYFHNTNYTREVYWKL